MVAFNDEDQVRVKECKRVKKALHGIEGVIKQHHCMSGVYTVELDNGIVGAFRPTELEKV
jgi:hypothetical protein